MNQVTLSDSPVGFVKEQFHDQRSAGFRERAASELDAIPFPTNRQEEWKYTDPASFLPSTLQPAAPVSNTDLKEYDLVLHNGHVAFLNDHEGVSVQTLSSMNDADHQHASALMEKIAEPRSSYFHLLNSTSFPDAVVIKTNQNSKTSTLKIAHYASGKDSLSLPRILIESQPDSKLDVFIDFLSDSSDGNVVVPVIQSFAGSNSRIRIYKLQNESSPTVHIGHDLALLGSGAQFILHTTTYGGKMVRNNVYSALPEKDADCKLFGLYLPDGSQHVDNRTVMDHISPHCTSDEFYKGIMSGKSVASFNGKVFVRQGAQKINAFQRNQNILLSKDATVNSKPELEIYADDVKCSHGSTTGQFDEEAVFYLRSRGIGEIAARKLLVKAFAEDVLIRIPDLAQREKTEALLQQKLDKIL